MQMLDNEFSRVSVEMETRESGLMENSDGFKILRMNIPRRSGESETLKMVIFQKLLGFPRRKAH